MSRRADERTILRPLVADLARRYQDGEAGWQELMDRKVLRKFRRQLDETGELLAEQDCTPESVPEKGRMILIRRNANLSTGGTAVDCTAEVNPTI